MEWDRPIRRSQRDACAGVRGREAARPPTRDPGGQAVPPRPEAAARGHARDQRGQSRLGGQRIRNEWLPLGRGGGATADPGRSTGSIDSAWRTTSRAGDTTSTSSRACSSTRDRLPTRSRPCSQGQPSSTPTSGGAISTARRRRRRRAVLPAPRAPDDPIPRARSSAISQAIGHRSTTPTCSPRRCWPGCQRSRVTSRCGRRRGTACAGAPLASVPTGPGHTERGRTCNGSTTSTPATCWKRSTPACGRGSKTPPNRWRRASRTTGLGCSLRTARRSTLRTRPIRSTCGASLRRSRPSRSPRISTAGYSTRRSTYSRSHSGTCELRTARSSSSGRVCGATGPST